MSNSESNVENVKETENGNQKVSIIEKGAHIRLRGSMNTDVGIVREINQDSMLSMQITLNECCQFMQPRLFIVADGMGGEKDGDVASSMAIRFVATELLAGLLDKNCVFPIESSVLVRAIHKANEEIYSYSQQDETRNGMGTTITAALLVGNRLIIAHVGDTRAYFINRNEIRQITEDHSLVNKLLKMGQLTPEQAENYPHKNLVYKTLGTKAQVDVDIYEELLDVGDAVLICCDGLWDYFPNEELHKILTETEDFNKVPEILINLAKERGGKDNITLVIFELVSIE